MAKDDQRGDRSTQEGAAILKSESKGDVLWGTDSGASEANSGDTSSGGETESIRGASVAELSVVKQLALLGVDNPTQEQVDKGVELAKDPAVQAQATAELSAVQQLAVLGLENPTQAQVDKAVELIHDEAFQDQMQARLQATQSLARLGNEHPSLDQVEQAVKLMNDNEWQGKLEELLANERQDELLGQNDPTKGTFDKIPGLDGLLKPDGGAEWNPMKTLLDSLPDDQDGKAYSPTSAMLAEVLKTPGNTPFNPYAPGPGSAPTGSPTSGGSGGGGTSSGTSTTPTTSGTTTSPDRGGFGPSGIDPAGQAEPGRPSSSGTSGTSGSSGTPSGETPAGSTDTPAADTPATDTPSTGSEGDSGQSGTSDSSSSQHWDSSQDKDGDNERDADEWETTTSTTVTDNYTLEVEKPAEDSTERTTDDGYSYIGEPPPDQPGNDSISKTSTGGSGGSHEMATLKSGTIQGNPEHAREGKPGVVWGDYGDPADPNATEDPGTGDVAPGDDQPYILVDPDATDGTLSADQIQFRTSLGDSGNYGDPNDPNAGNDHVGPADNPRDTSPYEHDVGDDAFGDDGLP